MDCRWDGAMLVTLLLLTGECPAADPVPGHRDLHCIIGRRLDFGSVYDLGIRRDLHSVTLKVTRNATLRVFQYVFSGPRMIPTAPYVDRVKFDPDTGSLQLLNFTSSDTGLYLLSLITDSGTELSAYTHVHIYKPSQPEIWECRSGNNVSLHCAAENGTDLQYCWDKDGVGVEGSSWAALSWDRQNLTLLTGVPVTCGVYTCLVQNQLGLKSATYSLQASDGFPFCRGEPSRRKLYGILPVIVILLLVGIAVLRQWGQRAGNYHPDGIQRFGPNQCREKESHCFSWHPVMASDSSGTGPSAHLVHTVHFHRITVTPERTVHVCPASLHRHAWAGLP
ncbi:uncharacterized protein LOC127587218 isoform X2 [Pristis pectinata]|uniref:uncharacterized protein LOC127587218 isoform X2 n=1 Tax=Pristis pectinata TaxID=685728 RepID=UPI00223DFCDF|nr:uncharacterized protein LOC127587218 isoform X2 [Pristis pectinata]